MRWVVSVPLGSLFGGGWIVGWWVDCGWVGGCMITRGEGGGGGGGD